MPQNMPLEPPFEGANLYPTIESPNRRWYQKKKYFIPISLLAVLCIVGIIIGSVIGSRNNNNNS
ncbi:unnamed protein product, partial [Rotaria sordida]